MSRKRRAAGALRCIAYCRVQIVVLMASWSRGDLLTPDLASSGEAERERAHQGRVEREVGADQVGRKRHCGIQRFAQAAVKLVPRSDHAAADDDASRVDG